MNTTPTDDPTPSIPWRTTSRHGRTRPSKPTEQTHFATCARQVGYDFDPTITDRPQKVRCPDPTHHERGDLNPSASIHLGECWASCHVLGRSIGYREMRQAAGDTDFTRGTSPTGTLDTARQLANLPVPAIEAVLGEATRAAVSEQANKRWSTTRVARHVLQALTAWIEQATASDEPHTRNVQLAAADLERSTGINTSSFRATLTGLATLGFHIDWGESGRHIGRRKLGARIATARHAPDDGPDQPRRAPGCAATTVTADPDRLAHTLHRAHAWLNDEGKYPVNGEPPVVTSVSPTGVFTSSESPGHKGYGRVLADANLATHAPPDDTDDPTLYHRPGRARVMAMLAHRGVVATSDLAAQEGCTLDAMNARLRHLRRDGLATQLDRGIVMATVAGHDLYTRSVDAGRAAVAERVERVLERWKQVQEEAVAAYLDPDYGRVPNEDEPEPRGSLIVERDRNGDPTGRLISDLTGEIATFDATGQLVFSGGPAPTTAEADLLDDDPRYAEMEAELRQAFPERYHDDRYDELDMAA